MKCILHAALVAFVLTAARSFAQDDYRSLHFSSLVADSHNDVLLRVMAGRGISARSEEGHTDLVRLKEGGVDVQVFSVWMGPEYGAGRAFKRANRMIDSLERIVSRNKEKIALARGAGEAATIVAQGKIAAVIGVEGGHPIENKLRYLDRLHARGMRYMTLTWNNSTPWATSAEDETGKSDSLRHKGLTEFGKRVVRWMNALGVMVDLSHVGEQTFYDALAVTSKPVILSHSSVYVLAPHFRNLKDDQIRALAKNGGVMCINFYAGFLDSAYERRAAAIRDGKSHLVDSLMTFRADADHVADSLLAPELEAIRPPLATLIDHIDYVVKLVGDDYVGIGSDFDGVSVLPKEMDDVTFLPNITRELKKRGYTDASIRKILGGNFMRVFAASAP